MRGNLFHYRSGSSSKSSLISPADSSRRDKSTDTGAEKLQRESVVCSLVISESVLEKGTY